VGLEETMKTTEEGFDKFTTAYLVAALWSTNDESTPQGGEPLDTNYGIHDIAPDTIGQALKDCQKFQKDNKALLENLDLSQCGHDFWLTRNGHGAGFWDRDLGEVGEKLTEACKQFPEVSLYVGDDKQIWA
jgi:hypothetical protein